jgi:hypothetical protein
MTSCIYCLIGKIKTLKTGAVIMKQKVIIILCMFLVVCMVTGCYIDAQPRTQPTPDPPTPPEVESIEPANGAVNVELNAPIKVVFTVDILESSINLANVRLTGPKGNVSGTVTYDSPTRTATFTPGEKYNFISTYTLTVTGLEGAGLSRESQEFTSSFTTRDGVWGTPQKISSDVVPTNLKKK